MGRAFKSLCLCLFGLALSATSQASSLDSVSFSIAKVAAVKVLPSTENKQFFLVATNSPFEILAEGAIGEITVSVQAQGIADGVSYGGSSQRPGAARRCAQLTSFMSQSIYRAQRRTALRPGSMLQQSVLVTVTHGEFAKPKIKISSKPKSSHNAAKC